MIKERLSQLFNPQPNQSEISAWNTYCDLVSGRIEGFEDIQNKSFFAELYSIKNGYAIRLRVLQDLENEQSTLIISQKEEPAGIYSMTVPLDPKDWGTTPKPRGSQEFSRQT